MCHEAQVGDRILGTIEDLSVESYNKAIAKLIEDNRCKSAPCRCCSKGKEYVFKQEKITFVTVNPSFHCNSNCIYCHAHFEKKGIDYNPVIYLQEFHDKQIFDRDCFFDWGGGEPTLSTYFEETVDWINKRGYRQRINTNAIIFSKTTYEALENGKACLRISVDSGSRECFELMKGTMEYDKVWENIGKYAEASSELYIKYNICNYNSDNAEVETFIKRCVDCGIKHILIDAEISAYQRAKNAGPFYFTNKELEAAKYMWVLARENGMDVKISPYAFSVRAEYDDTGELRLPEEYFDNMDYDIVSNGILMHKFPTIGYMCNYIRDKKFVIWGAGKYGKMCLQTLKKNKIVPTMILDRNPKLWGTQIDNVPVVSPDEILNGNKEMVVIIGGKYWESMLKEINERNYTTGDIILMETIYYEEYLKEE